MRTSVQCNEWRSAPERRDKTDRPLRFPAGRKTVQDRGQMERSSSEETAINSARNQWLETHDVQTYFFDGGIGCCWFAQQGNQEPVCAETEDQAIERLAGQNGIELWDESQTDADAEVGALRSADVLVAN